MNFQRRSAIGIFMLGSILLLAMSAVYYLVSRHSAIEHTRSTSLVMVEDIAHSMDLFLLEKGRVAATIVSAPVLTHALEQSNADFAEFSKSERQEHIADLNEKWLAAQTVDDSIIQGALSNPVADYLRKQQTTFPGEYGEIFVTNRHGALIASTGRLTTLAHAHKYWWQAGYHEGQGRIFFDDRGYDTSVAGYVLGVVVPIRQGVEIIGILKCNLNILDALSDVIQSHGHHERTEDLKLVRSGGLIVLETGVVPLSGRVSNQVVDAMQERLPGSFMLPGAGGDGLLVHAPVSITHESKEYAFGGSPKSIDHTAGNTGESWHIVCSQSLGAILENSERATQTLMAVGVVFCLILAFGSALLSRALARPMMKLVEYTRRIGRGDFDVEVDIESKDELGVLTRSFNTMAHDLRQTVISRDTLLKEMKQRKQAEEALIQTQALFQAALDNSQAGIAIADAPDGQLRYVNNAGLFIRGGTKQDVIDDIGIKQYVANWKIVGLDGTPMKDDEVPLARAIMYGETVSRELIVQRDDEDDRFVLTNAAPIKNQQGEVVAGIAVFLDITLRKNAEAQLQRQFDLDETILQTSMDGFMTIDERGKLKTVNAAYCDIIGYTREELLTMSIEDLEAEETPGENARHLKAVLERGNDRFEAIHRTKDGSLVDLEFSAYFIDLEPEGLFVAFCRDITARLAAEQAELEYKSRLKSLATQLAMAEDQLRQEIAAGLHDSVGQNLAALKITFALLRRTIEDADHPTDPVTVTALDDINDTIERIIETTWSLTFELCPPGLHEMGIAAAVEWFVKQLADKHNIVFEFQKDWKPTPLANNVRGLAFQMIRELLLNAIKHGQPETIEVYMSRQNEFLRVEVRDNGCGFDAQAESGNKYPSGGFGLFSISERLRYFSGSMVIESVVGEGTCVTIEFPLDHAENREMEHRDG